MTIEDKLVEMGFSLKDCGLFWQASAIYRNGDNESALQIYKDSGVWKDYVEGTEFMPFIALVERVTGKREVSSVNFKAKKTKQKQWITMEKTWSKDCLKRLLPNYHYFEGRGISSDTQDIFQCGFASSGEMNRRIVFPIFNNGGRIHGFTGRTIDVNNSKVKWRHKGKTKDWFYPFYTVESCQKSILESEEVWIVESIGDSMALFQSGIQNNLVAFGASISPNFIAKLTSLPLQKIFLAFNNDSLKDGSKEDAGLIAMSKTFGKLIDFYDQDKIIPVILPKNDFGSMKTIEIKSFCAKVTSDSNQTHEENLPKVVETLKKLKFKKFHKMVEKIEKYGE